MANSDDLTTLRVLEKERDALVQEMSGLKIDLDALDRVIERYKLRKGIDLKNDESISIDNNVTAPVVNTTPKSEPSDYSRVSKTPKEFIVDVIKKFGKAVKLPDIEDGYTRLSGNKRFIRVDIKELRKEGVLTSIIYNKNTQLVFTGLSEWVIETDTGPTFKQEYAPFEPKLIKGIETTARIPSSNDSTTIEDNMNQEKNSNLQKV